MEDQAPPFDLPPSLSPTYDKKSLLRGKEEERGGKERRVRAGVGGWERPPSLTTAFAANLKLGV